MPEIIKGVFVCICFVLLVGFSVWVKYHQATRVTTIPQRTSRSAKEIREAAALQRAERDKGLTLPASTTQGNPSRAEIINFAAVLAAQSSGSRIKDDTSLQEKVEPKVIPSKVTVIGRPVGVDLVDSPLKSGEG